MRIQHNIMAMNAYRNYNNNTSALSKNLEKLSSGYKINRAGDDAAGLAISEKMRAQITGLNAAQKNVKDGISLVKTAEGAMQEIHDMLNRMKYLATQSANGTYDEDVDRFNLQKEVESLRSEINRIADSANFNGINLLDGQMGFGAAAPAGGEEKAITMEQMGRAGGSPRGANSEFTASATNVGTGKAVTAAEYNGQGVGEIKVSVAKTTTTDNQATSGALAEGTFKGATFGYSANGAAGNMTIKFAAGDSAAAAWDGTTKTLTVTLSKTGGTGSDGKYTASDVQGAIQGLKDSVTGNDDNAIDLSKITVSGTFNADGLTDNKIDFTAADATFTDVTLAGGSSAGTTYTATATIGTGDDAKTATAVLVDGDGNAATATFTGADLAGLTVTFDKSKFAADGAPLGDTVIGEAKAASENPPAGDDETDKIAAGTKVEIDMSAAKETNKNFKVGDTVKIGDVTYSFVAATEEGGGEPAPAVERSARATTVNVTLGADFDTSMSNLAAAIEAQKNTTGVGATYANGKLTLTTAKDFADADELKAATDIQITGADNDLKTAVEDAWNEAVEEAVGGGKSSGNGTLTLQIGDTSDSFNQLTVRIGDMHASALGKRQGTYNEADGTYTYADVAAGQSIADIDISTLTGAQSAISVIKDAINYVSSVRGDLGATQNRLEHTANNLSVMTENIQDAESTIRDTDVADEMMAYTKNNILIQSAQAMLAQANAVPQGVLQLLQ